MKKTIKAFAAVLMGAAMMLVGCKPAPVETLLTVSETTLTVAAENPASKTIKISANKAWQAAPSADWVTVSTSAGSGDADLELTFEENIAPEGQSAAARTANLVVTSEDKSVTVKINQNAEGIVVSIDQTEVNINEEAREITVKVSANTAFTVQIPADCNWITEVAGKAMAVKDITLAVEANGGAARTATVNFVGANGESKSLTVNQEAMKAMPLNSAEALVAFAAAVNAGADLAAFDPDGDGVFTLETDIDMKGVAWTPIGTATYSLTPDKAKMFRGVFDGANHKIDNLKVTLEASAAAQTTAGLFGSVYASTIKNLVMGEGCEFVSNAANEGLLGSIAGFTMNTTIENCKSYATVKYDGGTVDNKRQSVGGIVGSFNCSSADGMENADKSLLKDCTFYGTMTSKNAANTKNGGTGISLGGIVGFTECTKAADESYPNYNVVEACVNEGTVSGEATRIAGIAASVNNGTHVNNCINKGTISGCDMIATDSRVGGIASAMNARTDLKGCINYGTVEFTAADCGIKGFAAGIVGQPNDPTNVIDACENYGIVRSDIFKATDKFMGSIFGRSNKKAVTVKNCMVCGEIGPYTDFEANKVAVNTSNFETYISMASSTWNGTVIYENNMSASQIVKIGSAEELLAAAAVAKTLGTEDVVNITADITLPATELNAVIDTLNCTVNGQGHTIAYTMVDTLCIKSGVEHTNVGLVGVLNGKIRNLKTAGSLTFTPTVSGTYHIGGIVGIMGADAVIENCENGVKILSDHQATHHMGGIVGYTTAGATVKNCVNNASVEMIIPNKGTANASQIGGIIGHLEGTATVENCTNNGQVTYEGLGTPRIAGIAGYVNNVTRLIFKNCTNNGPIVWNEGNYNASSWSYVGGITGYYGTPTHDGYVTYDHCVNTGNITADFTETKSKARMGGIAAQGGISNNAYVANELTWEFIGCENKGNISGNLNSANNIYGGMIGMLENTAKLVVDGCKNSGSFTCKGAGKLGGIIGSTGGTQSTITNVEVDPATVLTVETTSTSVGLIGGLNSAYTSAVTGKVAGTIVKAGESTAATADNFKTMLFGVALGEGGSTDGVTFNAAK